MSFTESLDDIVEQNSNKLLGARPHWPRVRLGEVCHLLNGYPFESSKFTDDKGTPLLRIRDILPGKTETFYNGEWDRNYLVKPGDLVVGMDGDFNCDFWRGDQALLNQRVCKLTPDERRCSRKFLRYILPGYLSAIHAHTHSVTVKHLSSNTIKDIPLPIPSLGEQQQVVEEIDRQFSRLDEATTNLYRVRANIKRYKASLLTAAVEGRLVETEASLARRRGLTYETGEQLLRRIIELRHSRRKDKYQAFQAPKAIELSEIPEGWSTASIGQLSSVVEYGSSSKTTDDSTGIPVLRMGNIVEGELVFDSLKYLPKKHDEFPKLLLQSGDLLFNRTNSLELVGKTAVFSGYPQICSFASYLIRIRFVQGVVPEFISAYLNSTHGRRWVNAVVTQQVGQANVNGTKLQALAVPLPPASEQRRIVSEIERRLTLIRKAESQISANMTRAEHLRLTILASAFGPKSSPDLKEFSQ